MRAVTWFRHGHEQRNDLLRFGLMRLHRQGAIRYVEAPLEAATAHGFDEAVTWHEHRHTSVILAREGTNEARCLVDSEDSFFWMSPLIAHVDLYFCAGYSSDFFEQRRLFAPYAWQTQDEVAFYRQRVDELVAELGAHFAKARRFVPIGPGLHSRTPTPWLTQRWRNLRHKAASAVSRDLYWGNELLAFETRYAELEALRASELAYDVVLLDTLWGWPRHRLALHRELQRLSTTRQIRSSLNWSEPTPYDGASAEPLDRSLFPVSTGPVDDYERMLAQSRLAVFATGFHWGWRSIMSLALMLGLPVHMDRPPLEPWFDFEAFEVSWNPGDWSGIEARLEALPEAEWARVKARTQARYDEVMSPEAVAGYFLRAALG